MQLFRLRTIPGVIVATVAATFGPAVLPATAAAGTTLTGAGVFTAVSAPDYVPVYPNPPLSPRPCSVYTAYNAELVLSNPTTNVTAQLRSDPGAKWGEEPLGTHPDVGDLLPDCSGSVAAVSGFSAAITGVTGTTPVACSVTGTYKRSNYTDVQFVFSAVTPGTTCALSLPVTINLTIAGVVTPEPVPTLTQDVPIFGPIEFVSACAGVIAPPGCVFGPQVAP